MLVSAPAVAFTALLQKRTDVDGYCIMPCFYQPWASQSLKWSQTPFARSTPWGGHIHKVWWHKTTTGSFMVGMSPISWVTPFNLFLPGETSSRDKPSSYFNVLAKHWKGTLSKLRPLIQTFKPLFSLISKAYKVRIPHHWRFIHISGSYYASSQQTLKTTCPTSSVKSQALTEASYLC